MIGRTARSIELSDHGAHYYRSDFQVHSPRDTQWDGVRPTSEDERGAWARAFIAAARNNGLHAVAISDHHDFAYFPYVRDAALSETMPDGTPQPDSERIVIFPALELTLSVPCQAILILDAEFPVDRLGDVLKALHFDPVDSTLESLPQTTVLPDSGDLNDIHAKIDKNDWLRDRYIILPNVTPSGHKTLLRTSFQAKYRDMTSVGGYLDGSIDQMSKKKNAGEARILAGLDTNWGSKSLGLFQTSDSRTAAFVELGRHATWVKWAEPTAEAIRQACLAPESRISQKEPAIPNTWISRVTVSQSKFLGHVDVALNPQYTALIGGRGTGKSTILDYIRWTLCDQPAQTSADDEVADPRVRQRRLIEATLKPLGAHVEVHCMINGVSHVVRRSAADGTVELKVDDGDFQRVRESAIQSLLPIQAYSQKQLSSVAIRVDELLRFITSPIQRELEAVDRRIEDISGRLRENYGTLQRYRNIEAEAERAALQAESLAGQAQSLRDGLAGLTDADRNTLDEKVAYDGVRAAERAWLEQLAAAGSSLTALIATVGAARRRLDPAVRVPPALESTAGTVRDAIDSALADLEDAAKGLTEKYSEATGPSSSLGVHRTTLAAKIAEFEASYSAVKERSTAHEAKLEELAALEEQQASARELIQEQRNTLDSLGKPAERHADLRAELIAARTERAAALSAECEALSASSDGLIRASLPAGRGFAGAMTKLKSLITGSNVRANRVESLFEQLARSTDSAATWETVLQELEFLMLVEPDVDINSEDTPTLSRLGMPVGDQKKISTRLTPDGWLGLSLTELANFPAFEYRTNETEYIPFEAASAGQQASALLTTLLSQRGMPLIIDQPEDDLDNVTVQQIVTKIWSSKSRRQLVFSSHNANLVVNGDADLVLVCAYIGTGDQSSGHIKREGAIDVAAVRNEITAVMEGGERAFRLRKEKYGY